MTLAWREAHLQHPIERWQNTGPTHIGASFRGWWPICINHRLSTSPFWPPTSRPDLGFTTPPDGLGPHPRGAGPFYLPCGMHGSPPHGSSPLADCGLPDRQACAPSISTDGLHFAGLAPTSSSVPPPVDPSPIGGSNVLH